MTAVPLARDVEVVDDAARAHSLLHPARLQLLTALSEPASPVELARRLGLPRQRVNYHLRELESHQLIERIDERRRGSIVERTYRRTGRSFAISSAVLGPLGSDPADVQDRFSAAYQVALASRAVSELGQLESGARAADQRLATLAIDTELRFATAEKRAAFAEDLTTTIADLVERYHDDQAEGGRTFRLYAGAYPKPK